MRLLLPPPFWTASVSKRAKRGPSGTIGYDNNKKIKRRRRHLIVDTQGFLLAISVQAGNVQDRDGANEVLSYCQGTYPRLSLVWADSAYGGELVNCTASCRGWTLEIVKKAENQKEVKGFAVQPHRWSVERTFACLCKYRRLVRDYEYLTQSSAAMIRLAMCHLMIRRLKPA